MNKLQYILHSLGYNNANEVRRDIISLQSQEEDTEVKKTQSKIQPKYIPPSAGVYHSRVIISSDLNSYESVQLNHERYESKLFDDNSK